MKQTSPLAIYALAVCAISLAVFAASAVATIYAIVQVSVPHITMSANDYRRMASDESFVEHARPDQRERIQEWSPQEIADARAAFGSTAYEVERHVGQQLLVGSFFMALTMLLLLAVHVRLLRRLRAADEGD